MVTRLLIVTLVVIAVVSASTSSSAEPLVGGRDYFFCAAFQAVKIAGLFTANPSAVLAGAIGGGLACGFGW